MDREVEQSLLRDREAALAATGPSDEDDGSLDLTSGDWIAIAMATLGVLFCVGAAVAWAVGWIE